MEYGLENCSKGFEDCMVFRMYLGRFENNIVELLKQFTNTNQFTHGCQHRWELPVGNYHGIRGNYHYPFIWIIFLVILHDFICKNYHENHSDRYPFPFIMINYPTFLINYHILNFQMYYQNIFLFLEYPKNASFLFESASFGKGFL